MITNIQKIDNSTPLYYFYYVCIVESINLPDYEAYCIILSVADICHGFLFM